MSAPADPASAAHQWLDEAWEELLMAHHIADNAAMPMRGAAFHAHLAAAKALKGLAFTRGLALVKVHDLSQLFGRLPLRDAEQFGKEDLERLNPWQSGGRYVGDLPDQVPIDVTGLIAAAERVVAAATRRIEGDGT